MSPGLFVCGGCFAVQDAFIRPAPRHLWQSGTESRITFLGCGRTALPVPPQDGQMSATIIGLGFFRIMSVCSSGCISKKKGGRDHGTAGHGGNQNASAMPWLLSRATISDHESYRLPNWPKNVTTKIVLSLVPQRFPAFHGARRLCVAIADILRSARCENFFARRCAVDVAVIGDGPILSQPHTARA